MAEPSNPSNATGSGVTVVLLLPEAIRGVDSIDHLRKTLTGSSRPIRVLLCLPDGYTGENFVTMLQQIGVETQILVGPTVRPLPDKALRAPPDIIDKDFKELVLGLSDTVLMAPISDTDSEQTKLFKQTASDLGKLDVVPGNPIRHPGRFDSVTKNLDPVEGGAPGWWRFFAGRLEQALLELFAYNWQGRKNGGLSKSAKRLFACFGWWRKDPYFAPESWPALAPDDFASSRSAPIAARCDALDRSASYGSFVHRDLTWFVHLAAAFAVLAAVAGHLRNDAMAGHPGHDATWWPFAELVALGLVVILVFFARRKNLQERWTACRLGAEQLRIARMSLPLLVLPPALATKDAEPEGQERRTEVRHGFEALTEVKHIVRQHGLPSATTAKKAANWVKFIVDDQILYHHINHHKLDCAESRLLFVTQAIFVLGICAVVAHFYVQDERLLLITAAAPAFAAALHGIGTRLGIVHRAALSAAVETQLKKISASLDALIPNIPSEKSPGIPSEETPVQTAALKKAWQELRHFTSEAAKAMGSENDSWHGLVRRYRDVLP